MASLFREAFTIYNVNINEENVLAIGQCFPFAVQMADKWWNDHIDKTKRPGKGVHPDIDNKDKFKVVHGTVTNKWDKSAKPVIHAWVEMGDKVFDDQTSATKPNGVDKAIYYDNFQPEPKHEYTAEEVVINCMVKGGPGPWDEEFIEKIKARDAWLGETRMDIEQIIKEELTKYLKEEPGKGPVHVIGSLIHQHGLMGAGEALEQMGFDADFVTSPLPMWMLEKDGVKYAALNKKYVEDADLIVGDIAIGVMG